MAKREGRFTPPGTADDPTLQDASPELWNEELGEVARGLLTSAVRCFASVGYHATTTRDISAGVGLSPAALYVHFPSKELVLYEIIRSGHTRALACVQQRPVEGSDSVERLRLLVSGYTAWHARHHVAARVCQYMLAGLTAEHYDEIMRLRRETNQVFRDAVALGVEDETFEPVDVNRVVRALLSLSIDLVRWYRMDGHDLPEEVGGFYADLALKLVGPVDVQPGAVAPGQLAEPDLSGR